MALSSNGNTALIGGSNDNGVKGAAWVFTRTEGKWTQQGTKLTGSGESGDSAFGAAVALSSEGNTALIGGPEDNSKRGAAWVFTRSEGKWAQQGSKLIGGSEVEDPGFGFSVALSGTGNTALIGGPFDGGPIALWGAAWEFSRTGTSWTARGPKISLAKQTEDGTEFGNSVALAAEVPTALIGGDIRNNDVGAAWVYTDSSYSEEALGISNEGKPHATYCFRGYPVNCATGNEVVSQTDFTIGGRGPGLNATRTYNSQLAVAQGASKEHGPFGYGWTGPYSAHLVVSEELETATVHQNNGSAVTFNLTSSNTYVGANGLIEATLVKEGSEYSYTLPDQTTLKFSSAGQLISESDRDGNAVTIAHNSEGRVESATDGAGRKLSFTYNGEGLVESVKDPMGHTVKYTYESGNLSSVTQPGEAALRWQFKYNGEHELTAETDGRGHTIKTEYNGSHQVSAQTDALERTRKWSYAGTEEEPQTTITEPNSSTTVEKFNREGQPTSVTLASGTSLAATTTYEYDGYMHRLGEPWTFRCGRGDQRNPCRHRRIGCKAGQTRGRGTGLRKGAIPGYPGWAARRTRLHQVRRIPVRLLVICRQPPNQS